GECFCGCPERPVPSIRQEPSRASRPRSLATTGRLIERRPAMTAMTPRVSSFGDLRGCATYAACFRDTATLPEHHAMAGAVVECSLTGRERSLLRNPWWELR